MTSSHAGWIVHTVSSVVDWSKTVKTKTPGRSAAQLLGIVLVVLLAYLCVVLGYTCACLCRMCVCSACMHFISACLCLRVCVCECNCLNMYIACIAVSVHDSLQPVHYCCVLECVCIPMNDIFFFTIFGILSFIGKCYYFYKKQTWNEVLV